MFHAKRLSVMSRRLLQRRMRPNYNGTKEALFSSSFEALRTGGGASQKSLENTFEMFRKESGAVIDDLATYVSSWLHANPLGEIHVGADSRSVEGVVIFAVAVCLYQKSEGGHVLYKKLKVPYQGSRKNLVHCRLLEECSQALAVADELNASLKTEQITVHIDCNPEPSHLSHSIHNSGLGWIKSAGFKARAKPDAWAASSVANYIVNGNFGVSAQSRMNKKRDRHRKGQAAMLPKSKRAGVERRKK
mmetsp:Transcript_5994/g.8247  ORF Transcript_5994/g.8247 Transcript_5994/m.8247 type:complete len:247 (+) Transcript_5994:98-838(+)